ncbi:hypothetical protein [Pseudomonas sp. DP-17]|uniref:hypothetical protein n=1 Tax=Pseudomonas sp. DP-17 TaxID=1580486 RepID=UPI001EFBC9BF|nr:hypothetical protein [Pseudomonas sp. DP-17]MCG8911430.1 hypothetical protein [Pseudomonas sp. DP-17]
MKNSDVIRWGAPIPSFGDPSIAQLATLGLNPSDKEYTDNTGIELDNDNRRFHTLHSLGIESWKKITSEQLHLIEKSCTEYFLRNPYNNWFKPLDSIISGTSTSYYNKLFHAVHLDLIPFATQSKWANLKQRQKDTLLKSSEHILGKILKESPIKVIILNGSTVVENFIKITNTRLNIQHIPEWDLSRASSAKVKGIAYRGVVKTVSNISLDSPILALGFNHNIQSSFGVTTKVRKSITDWVTEHSAEVL